MFPDLKPLFWMLFFAIGFVPVIVLGALVSIFVPVPLWAIALAGGVVGCSVTAWFSRS